MEKWYLSPRIILFFTISLVSLNTAFPEGDVPLILPGHLTKMTGKTEKSNRIEKKDQQLVADAGSTKKKQYRAAQA